MRSRLSYLVLAIQFENFWLDFSFFFWKQFQQTHKQCLDLRESVITDYW